MFFSLKNLIIMSKNMNTKLTKLIKYYSLINHNLIFCNKSINRYKANKPVVERKRPKNWRN